MPANKTDYSAQTFDDIPFDEIFDKHDIKAVFIDLDGTIVKRRKNDITDEVLAHLRALLARDGVKVAIATNRIRSGFEMTLKKHSLNIHYFGGKLPFRFKPYKSYFDLLIAHAKVPAENCLMIGNKKRTDIRGANRAGMITVLIKQLR